MTVEVLPAVQIFADFVLFFAIIFLIRIVNQEIKKRSCGIDAELLPELKKLIEDSRNSADNLLQTLNEGRKSLKETAYALDEKEKRLRSLLEESNNRIKELNSGDSDRREKYEEVRKLAKQGLGEKEIAQIFNLTEGEVCLILNLDRKKNENV
jgi:septal ring factor EnvC (AmiA/AmiB activator)